MTVTRQALAALALAAFVSHSASAAGFGDRFKSFVLGPQAQARTIDTAGAGLDKVAAGCLQCHDGLSANAIGVRRSGSPTPVHGNRTLNHPLGMAYGSYASRDPHGYRSIGALDPNIRLVDGKVSCVSCHRLKTEARETVVTASREPAGRDYCTATTALTVGGKQSDLCLGCHIK